MKYRYLSASVFTSTQDWLHYHIFRHQSYLTINQRFKVKSLVSSSHWAYCLQITNCSQQSLILSLGPEQCHQTNSRPIFLVKWIVASKHFSLRTEIICQREAERQPLLVFDPTFIIASQLSEGSWSLGLFLPSWERVVEGRRIGGYHLWQCFCKLGIQRRAKYVGKLNKFCTKLHQTLGL